MSATLAQRLGLPKMHGHGALVVAYLIDALGTGLYLPFSLLYFQRVAGFALPAIGVALSIATALTLPMIPLMGTLVDRLGQSQWLWLLRCSRRWGSWAISSSTVSLYWAFRLSS